MFNLIKSVITAGDYKLTEIRHKINKFYLLGNITEKEMDELLMLAVSSASTNAERPEYLTMLQHLADEVAALRLRVTALEGGAEDSTVPPAWKPWDGISKDYACGAVVSHNGQLWISVFNGQNVWEPGVSGNAFWIRYTE